MDEKEYRQKVQEIFHRIEVAIDAIDPDVVECESAFGALTLLFPNKTKCILSTQPSVRQIWLAAASKGIAFHFNFDTRKSQWFDDKGMGIELNTCVRGLVRESAGVDISL